MKLEKEKVFNDEGKEFTIEKIGKRKLDTGNSQMKVYCFCDGKKIFNAKDIAPKGCNAYEKIYLKSKRYQFLSKKEGGKVSIKDLTFIGTNYIGK